MVLSSNSQAGTTPCLIASSSAVLLIPNLPSIRYFRNSTGRGDTCSMWAVSHNLEIRLQEEAQTLGEDRVVIRQQYSRGAVETEGLFDPGCRLSATRDKDLVAIGDGRSTLRAFSSRTPAQRVETGNPWKAGHLRI